MSAKILLMKVGTLLFGFPRLVWVFILVFLAVLLIFFGLFSFSAF